MARKDNRDECAVDDCSGGMDCYKDCGFNPQCYKCSCSTCKFAECPPSMLKRVE